MITYHHEVTQGSDEWLAQRCGLITASEMKLIMTPRTRKAANNDESRAHVYELLAQRITKYVEPHYVSDDMLRGQEDELDAKIKYNEHYAPVQEVGFVTNDQWGFTLGYSPDGIIGEDGLIECKSRRQKYQIKTIVEHGVTGEVPDEYMLQIQTGLLVTGRSWCDFISYSGGLHMITIRVFPDLELQKTIIEVATDVEKKIAAAHETYNSVLKSSARLLPTERRVEQEITC